VIEVEELEKASLENEVAQGEVQEQQVHEQPPETLIEKYISRTFKEGDLIKGLVVAVENDSALVDIGYKSEGIVPLKELSREPVSSAKDVVKVGDELTLYVLKVEDDQGNIILSKKRADYEMAWARIKEAFQEGKVVEAPIARNVKGGVLVDLGIWGFVPRSQIGSKLRGNRNLIGEVLRLKVVELDEENRKFTCSARKVEEEERELKKVQVFTKIKEGDIVSGKVSRIVDWGVFVDVGGVDGLIHFSELSWGAPKHPSKFVSVGEEIKVKVLKVVPEEGRISLSLRQTEPDPWENVELKYPVGSTAQGKVVKLGKYGAIVELEKGISGLVHISELADEKVNKPEEVVKMGDEVLVKVINLKKKERRITLSMKPTELEKETPPPPKSKAKNQERVEHLATLGDIWRTTSKE
jgi:4-hydroxy-3-methylbut-2-enyl diphosphate reductase